VAHSCASPSGSTLDAMTDQTTPPRRSRPLWPLLVGAVGAAAIATATVGAASRDAAPAPPEAAAPAAVERPA